MDDSPEVSAGAGPVKRGWKWPSLTAQIMIGLVIGGVVGYIWPKFGMDIFFLRDIFLNLVKSIIAPLIFSTIVVGIAGEGAAEFREVHGIHSEKLAARRQSSAGEEARLFYEVPLRARLSCLRFLCRSTLDRIGRRFAQRTRAPSAHFLKKR